MGTEARVREAIEEDMEEVRTRVCRCFGPEYLSRPV